MSKLIFVATLPLKFARYMTSVICGCEELPQRVHILELEVVELRTSVKGLENELRTIQGDVKEIRATCNEIRSTLTQLLLTMVQNEKNN